MNIFKRSKSIVSRANDRPADPQASSSSSSKPPIFQINPAPQYTIPAKEDVFPIAEPVSVDGTGKSLVNRKNRDRYVEDPKSLQYASSSSSSLSPHPRMSLRAPKTIYANNPDMYTQNDLNTFSFGAAPSTHISSSSYQPVDPLLRPRDDADSDEAMQMPDTTPRPSVVGSAPHRTHPSHSLSFRPGQADKAPKVPKKSREQDSDTTSTFDTSSASASVSSLPEPRQNHRGISARFSETPQSSSNDLTSDEDAGGRHPFPPNALAQIARGLRNRDQESSLYLSEEDFENDNEDFDHDVNNGLSNQKKNFERPNITINLTERRGSLARDIPSAQSDRSYMENPRDHYSRRPSRSLEELSSFSFAKASAPPHAGRGVEERPLPLAPTSVPESEGDWRDLRKKSVQRDKELPFIFNSAANMSSATASGSDLNTNNNMGAVSSSSSSNDISFQWMQTYGVNGVVMFDPSEVSDFLGEGPSGQRQSFNAFRKGSSSTYRRQSTVSSVDIFNKYLVGWGGKRMKTQTALWSFIREKDRAEGESANRQNGDRERSSIVALFSSSRPSTSTGVELSTSVSRTLFDKPDSKERAKEKSSGKDKPTKEPWRGMALDAEETWGNGALGRFRVVRRNTMSNEPGKPPQQRLNISFIRVPYSYNPPNSEYLEGPTITIHKHSKAGAFSISRHFRIRGSPGLQDTSFRNNAASTIQVTARDSDVAEGGRKKANTMILLAPRRVQRAYTSTNTTRKLESHGLLDESGRTSPRDIERMRREHGREEQLRAKEGEKDKKKDKKDKGNGKEKEKGLEKDRIRKTAESSSRRSIGGKAEFAPKDFSPPELPVPGGAEGSSAGVIARIISISSGDSETLTQKSMPTVTTSESTLAPPSVGFAGSADSSTSVFNYEAVSSDRTVQRAVRSHHRKRGVYDIDDEDDDSSDERPRYPTRTPHRETYAALPPEVFENVHQEHPSHGLFGWGKSRSNDRNGHRINPYLEASYNPPWPTTLPRANSETRKFIVDDLNTSFQDVGLLPATGEIKGSGHGSQHKRKQREHQAKPVKRPAEHQPIDIFEQVPADSLYMLLPLWPGETDPASARKQPFAQPHIPTDKRLYLLIYYKIHSTPDPPAEAGKTKSTEKKRSRESSNSGDNDRTVLLSSFYISARVVAYSELQGTGVRIPDLGLAVSGRMDEAFNTMPPMPPPEYLRDYVIGFCHSRDNGVEFTPEGFEKLGLATHVPNRVPIEPAEDDDNQSADFVAILTPIGRAVMEMAWLGGLAVTSFNPNL